MWDRGLPVVNADKEIMVMWENIGNVCVLLMTGILSLSDIRTKKLPVKILLIDGVIALLFCVIYNEPNGFYILQSIGPGGVLLLLSKITKESIGYGDGIVVMLIGLFCGTLFTVVTVGVAFFLSGIYAVFLLWKRRGDKMPFLPFLLLAMEVIWLYE